MASPSVAAFFGSRKRTAVDDLSSTKNKIIRLDGANHNNAAGNDGSDEAISAIDHQALLKAKLGNDACINKPTIFSNVTGSTKTKPIEKRASTRRTVKRNADSENPSQPKIVKFTLAGTLSPRKKHADIKNAFNLKQTNPTENSTAPTAVEPQTSGAQALSSPARSKVEAVGNAVGSAAKRDLSFDQIKTKVNRSSKLEELKAILKNRAQLEQQLQACVQKRSGKLIGQTPAKAQPEGTSLKKFDTIELEVLSR